MLSSSSSSSVNVYKKRKAEEYEIRSVGWFYEEFIKKMNLVNEVLEPKIEKQRSFENLRKERNSINELRKEGTFSAYVCPAYAEFNNKSLFKLVSELLSTCRYDKDEKQVPASFVDLGSGFGKIVFAASVYASLYNDESLKTFVGIEYMEDRHSIAQESSKEVNDKITGTDKIRFINGDIFEWGKSQAKGFTHAVSFDVLYPKELMKAILEMFSRIYSFKVWVTTFSPKRLVRKLGCTYHQDDKRSVVVNAEKDEERSFLLSFVMEQELSTTGVDSKNRPETYNMYTYLIIH